MSGEAPPAGADQQNGETEEPAPQEKLPFNPPCMDLTDYLIKADYFEVGRSPREAVEYNPLCVPGHGHAGGDRGEGGGSRQPEAGLWVPSLWCGTAKPGGDENGAGQDQSFL